MLDKQPTQPIRKRTGSRITIRAQIILLTGLILVMATMIAVIGFMNLMALENVVKVSLQTATSIREFSLGVQNEFLQARQSESNLLSRWRTYGFDVQATTYVTSNKNHIDQAKTLLDQMGTLVKSSNDPGLNSLTSEIADLRPLIDNYQNAFNATVSVIRERTRPAGVESNLQEEIYLLENAFINSPNDSFLQTVLRIQANEEAYFNTGKQEYTDNVRIQINRLITLLKGANTNDLRGSSYTAADLVKHANNYLAAFDQLVGLEQEASINEEIFHEVTLKIIQDNGRIGTVSKSGLDHAKNQLNAITRQTTISLLVTAVLALGLGILASLFLTRRISIPLNQLTKAAESMGRGNLDKPVVVTGGRELYTLAKVFNTMADQIRQTMEGLEQRVAERTRDLERRSAQLQVAAEVARDATSTRQLDVLLNRAVNIIRDRYGFYHAGIFLIDQVGEYAVLQAATGEAGRNMIERNHKLKVGETGIVGKVCSSGKSRISLDVGADAVHFKNPFLPETRSEMALPLKVGQQVIGALDVQSREASAFEQEDVTVLQTMADQLAIAIENARLFHETQVNLQQLQTLYGEYSQEAWARISQAEKIAGYQYDRLRVSPIIKTTSGNDEQLDHESGVKPYSIPLKIRGQEIGTLDVWPDQDEWLPEEKSLLNILGERISQAMESGRLFDETRARAASEQTLSQLTASFSRSLGLDTLLKTAVQELGQLPGVTEVAIHIGTPEKTTRDLEAFEQNSP